MTDGGEETGAAAARGEPVERGTVGSAVLPGFEVAVEDVLAAA
jgi:hypothetical protein